MMPTQLRHTLDIQKPTSVTDSVGDAESTWVTIKPVRASVVPLSTTERMGYAGKSERGEITHRITIRHDPALSEMATDWRAKWGSRILYFAGPPKNVNERDRWVEIVATEGLRA